MFRLVCLLLLGLFCLSADPVAASLPWRPVSFEENTGQLPGGSFFQARRPGHRIEFHRAALSIHPSGGPAGEPLLISLLNANPNSEPRGEQLESRRTHYLHGVAASPLTARHFQKVLYPALHAGVDLVFYGNEGKIEFDYVLAPGSDPAQLGIRFSGHDRIELTGEGDLLVQSSGFTLRKRKPVAYQIGRDGRREVTCSFRLRDSVLSFAVGEYVPTLPLIIDPVIEFSTYLGGSGQDYITAVETDKQGNIYLLGYTSSPTRNPFPATPGALMPTYRGDVDVVLTKLKPDGSAVLYSTYIGGIQRDTPAGLAIDPAGNVYITGNSGSPDFPRVGQAISTELPGPPIGFLAKLPPDGSRLIFCTVLNGVSAGPIALDSAGTIVLGGSTNLGEFPTTPGALQRSFGGGWDGLILKVSPSGSDLLYSTFLGGSGSDRVTTIALDSDGSVFAGGSTHSTDLPVTPGVFQPTPRDSFLAKLDPSGTSLVFASYLTGTLSSIALGPSGNIHLTGEVGWPGVGVTEDAFQKELYNRDGYLVILTPAASHVVYATHFGGYHSDYALRARLDARGNIYIAGYTTDGNNFSVTPDSLMSGTDPGNEYSKRAGGGFLVVLGPDRRLKYSTLLYASEYSRVLAMALTPEDDVLLAGYTQAADFPVTPSAIQEQYIAEGMWDGFLTKISFRPGCDIAVTPASLDASPSGGSFPLTVTTPAGCNWTVTSNSKWIHSSRSGTQVTIIVDPNPDLPRNGLVFIGTQKLPVNQSDGCTYQFPKLTYEFTHRGGSDQIRPESGTSCVWTATTDASWLKFYNNASSYTSNGAIDFQVSTNFSPEPRTAYIQGAGQTITIVQKGSPCTYSLAEPVLTLPYNATFGRVAIETQDGCPWTSTTEAQWMSGNGGSGSDYAVVFTGLASKFRQDVIYFADLPLLVRQLGPEDGFFPTVVGLEPRVSAGTRQTFQFQFNDLDQDLGVVNVLINQGLDGRRACYLAYDVPSKQLYLVDDIGEKLSGFPLQSDGAAYNSQCTVTGFGSSASLTQGLLTLTLQVQFDPSFTGNKVIYLAARDQKVGNSGWKALGVYRVGAVESSPRVDSISQERVGSRWAFQIRYSGLRSGEDYRAAQLLLNSSLDGLRACYVGFDIQNSVVYLVNNSGTALQEGILPSGDRSSGNSQCRLYGPGTYFERDGDALIVNLRFTFGGNFGGPKIGYAGVQTVQGRNSGWQALHAFGNPLWP